MNKAKQDFLLEKREISKKYSSSLKKGFSKGGVGGSSRGRHLSSFSDSEEDADDIETENEIIRTRDPAMLLSPYSLSSKATTPSKSRGAAPLPSTFVTAVGRNQNTSLLNSPTRRSNPSTPNTRPRKSKNNNGTESLTSDDLMSEIELQLNQLSLENQKKITIYQQEKENQRTLTIQQEIKQKEKEFYYYETNTVKQLYEKELNRIQEYHDKEEKHLLSHISVLSNEISQLISDREKYLMKVKEEKKKLQSQTTETEQLEKDMQSIQNGILTIQKNITEKEEIHKSQLKDDIIHRYEKEIQQLQEKYDENEKEMKIMGEEYQQRIQMKEKDHAKQLQQLNDSVSYANLNSLLFLFSRVG